MKIVPSYDINHFIEHVLFGILFANLQGVFLTTKPL